MVPVPTATIDPAPAPALTRAPEGAGGWRAWTQSLATLLGELATCSTSPVSSASLVSIAQTGSERSILLTIADGTLHVETASPSTRGARALGAVGYRPSADGSWHLEEPLTAPLRSAELVAHTLTAVLGVDGHRPVEVTVVAER